MKKNSSFPLLVIDTKRLSNETMHNGDVKKTKAKGGSGKSSSGVCSFGRNCKFGKKGMCNKGSCEAQAFWVSKNTMVPAGHAMVPAGYQLVPAGNQMVPSGGNLEQAGNGFAQSLSELCNFIVAPIQKRLDEVEQTARGASVDATEAKEAAAKAQTAAESAIDSFKEEMARERKQREEREAERERRETEREAEREKREADSQQVQTGLLNMMKQMQNQMQQMQEQMQSRTTGLSVDDEGDDDS